jgi:hypothetical protein
LLDALQGKHRAVEQTVTALPNEQAPSSGKSGIANLVASAVAVIRNVAAGVLLTIVAVDLAVAFYPRDGLVAMASEWFTPRTDVASDFDSNTAATEPVINPYLWQAVSEAYAQVPGTIDERQGSLETDWFNVAGEPDMRRRIAIRVGTLLESYDLSVNLRLQKQGLFGLWVEQDSYWDARKRDFVGIDPYMQQQEIADRLLARAKELAEANPE